MHIRLAADLLPWTGVLFLGVRCPLVVGVDFAVAVHEAMQAVFGVAVLAHLAKGASQGGTILRIEEGSRYWPQLLHLQVRAVAATAVHDRGTRTAAGLAVNHSCPDNRLKEFLQVKV